MNWLVDTNILLRLVELESPQHEETKIAVSGLLNRGFDLHVNLQNLAEFWNVCTRLVESNGLELSLDETNAELSKIELVFDFLVDNKDFI